MNVVVYQSVSCLPLCEHITYLIKIIPILDITRFMEVGSIKWDSWIIHCLVFWLCASDTQVRGRVVFRHVIQDHFDVNTESKKENLTHKSSLYNNVYPVRIYEPNWSLTTFISVSWTRFHMHSTVGRLPALPLFLTLL